MSLLLLEPELPVTEDLVDHLLREDSHAVDGRGRLGFQAVESRIRLRGPRCGRLLRPRHGHQHRNQDENGTAPAC